MSKPSKSDKLAGTKRAPTGCSNCGSTRFDVLETSAYTAEVRRLSSGQHVLHCCDADRGIDSITCQQCGEEHSSLDFAEIAFD